MTNKKANPAWIWVSAILCILAIGFMAHDSFEKPIVEEKVVIPEGYISQSDANAQVTAVQSQLDSVNSQLTDLQSKLDEKETEVAEEEKVSSGYLIDELIFGESYSDTLSDREVSKLFDGVVEFDGEDYDAEETFVYDTTIAINGDDFKENVYASILEGGLEYNVVFEDKLNTSLINEDETLKFNFLGEEVEISNWNSNSVTFTKGNKHFLKEGETIDLVTLTSVFEDSAYLSVNGVNKRVDEGETVKFGDVEVRVDEVLYQGYEGGTKAVEMTISDKVEFDVENDDEYADDSIWNWKISSNSIGLVLNENFNELDEDEDYQVLATDEQICLPNEYVCLKYNGISEEDTEKYTFDLNDGMVRIKGNFEAGLEDYDRIYFDGTNFIDEDEEVISGTIKLGDSDVVLSNDGTSLTLSVDSIVIPMDLETISINSKVIGDGDEDNYRTDYGIVIENPEDSYEDAEWTLVVPLEQLEASVSVF